MNTPTATEDLLAALRNRVRGTVAVPGDPAYPGLVEGFHLAFQHTPPIAVDPADAADVAAVVAAAASAGIQVTALGEGHGFHFGVTDGVVIKMRSLRSVEINEEARTARIGAGTTWQEVHDVSEPLGLVPLSGADAGVGAVGYILGGGLGPFGRTYGYGADSARSFEVVTGEGQLITVNEAHYPDLFWALRGGNHGLGVVVAMTVELVSSADIHGDAWYFAAEDLERLLRGWVAWGHELPSEMNSYAFIFRMPDVAELPDSLRGRTLFGVHNVYVGDQTKGEQLAAPLLKLATPVLYEPGRIQEDTSAPQIVTDGGIFLDSIDDAALDAILELAGPQHSAEEVPLMAVGLQLLGGALATPQSADNAVTGRDAQYAFHIIGADPEAVATRIPQQIRDLHRAVARLQSSGTIPNYIGPSNEPGAVAQAWVPYVRARLEQIRERYDPAGIFANSHTN